MLELGETIVSCADVSVFMGILVQLITSALILKSSQLLPLSVRQGAENQHFCEPLIA